MNGMDKMFSSIVPPFTKGGAGGIIPVYYPKSQNPTASPFLGKNKTTSSGRECLCLRSDEEFMNG